MSRLDPIESSSSASVPLLGTSPSSYPPSFTATPSRRPSLPKLLVRLCLPVLTGIILATVYLSLASPDSDLSNAWSHRNGTNVNVFDKLEIVSDDGSARAVFLALGASLNEFHVRDNKGQMRDVVVGYRDSHASLNESSFAYFGAIVGRYANRISQSSFVDPSTNETFHLPTNEGASTTLHGGKWGYSRAGWRVDKHDRNEIVFSLHDDGAEGFPGTVETTATYTLLASPARLVTRFHSRVVSPLPIRTPISLSSHVYWNLDGYDTPEGNGLGGNMKLWVDADRTVRVDDTLVPTGDLDEIDVGGPLDFYSGGAGRERELRDAIEDDRSQGLCGKGCTGLDNALIYSNPDRDFERDVVMTLSSPSSGIRLKVRTNQPLVHLYSCNSPLFSSPSTPGAYPFKASQNKGEKGAYGRWSCLAVEQEGWIDGVHHEREWSLERDKSQWYDVGREYDWWSEYEFGTS
ncbi:hypothetical protein JCM11491_002084 [Sporobolomyces phaffii]